MSVTVTLPMCQDQCSRIFPICLLKVSLGGGKAGLAEKNHRGTDTPSYIGSHVALTSESHVAKRVESLGSLSDKRTLCSQLGTSSLVFFQLLGCGWSPKLKAFCVLWINQNSSRGEAGRVVIQNCFTSWD